MTETTTLLLAVAVFPDGASSWIACVDLPGGRRLFFDFEAAVNHAAALDLATREVERRCNAGELTMLMTVDCVCGHRFAIDGQVADGRIIPAACPRCEARPMFRFGPVTLSGV